MIGASTVLVGLILIGLAVVMFLAAIPRPGEVVGFLRDKDNMQAAYALALVAMLFVGIVLIVLGVTR
jgi:hypothetical protein